MSLPLPDASQPDASQPAARPPADPTLPWDPADPDRPAPPEQPPVDLADRVALVTGASSGIGRAIALELARHGAHVCVNYHAETDEADDVVAEIRALGRKALAFGADVSRPDQVAAMFAATVTTLGRLDILVNNAGVEKRAAFTEISEADWDLVLGINLKGAFLCAQGAARRMISQGGGGRIINVSSVHEELPFPGLAPYAASKGGLRMLCRTAALELAPHGITMVNVGPGAIATPINRQTLADPARIEALDRQVPVGRVGDPDEVARLVAWLASDKGSYVTATTFFIDGGLMHQATNL